jgi:hypothetical protein
MARPSIRQRVMLALVSMTYSITTLPAKFMVDLISPD